MRDKLIHDYFGVDMEAVWRTVEEDVPPLHQFVARVGSVEGEEQQRYRGPRTISACTHRIRTGSSIFSAFLNSPAVVPLHSFAPAPTDSPLGRHAMHPQTR
jgi:hypothetical protein